MENIYCSLYVELQNVFILFYADNLRKYLPIFTCGITDNIYHSLHAHFQKVLPFRYGIIANLHHHPDTELQKIITIFYIHISGNICCLYTEL